jgi:drug/metabolite transporter (DMT)-like permease
MTARPTRGEWLTFLALGLLWGSSYLFIKIGVETLQPLTLISGRLLVGTLVLLAVVVLTRPAVPRDLRMYGHLVVMAALSVMIPFLLVATAEQTTDSALAAIVNAAIPLVAVTLSAVMLREERLTGLRLVGLGLGFLGVVIAVSRGLGSDGADAFGVGALAMSTVSYAAGAVYARRFASGVAPAFAAFAEVGFAFVMAAVLAVLFERPLATSFRPDAIFAILWLGVLGSGIAYLLFFRLLGRWGATRTSLVAYELPIVGIILGAVVLGEVVDARLILGTALIVAGVGFVNGAIRRPRGLARLNGIPAVRPGPVTHAYRPDR